MLRVYRTRVPAESWYDAEVRAEVLAALEADERRPIGFDESRLHEGVILLISIDKESRPLPSSAARRP